MESCINEHGIEYLPALDKVFANRGVRVVWSGPSELKYDYNIQWKDRNDALWKSLGLVEPIQTPEDLGNYMLKGSGGLSLEIHLHEDMLYFNYIDFILFSAWW